MKFKVSLCGGRVDDPWHDELEVEAGNIREALDEAERLGAQTENIVAIESES